jgi:hypothetical protein
LHALPSANYGATVPPQSTSLSSRFLLPWSGRAGVAPDEPPEDVAPDEPLDDDEPPDDPPEEPLDDEPPDDPPMGVAPLPS